MEAVDCRPVRLEPDRDQLELFMDCLLHHRGHDDYLSLRAFTHSGKLLSPILIKAQLPHDDFRHIVDYAVDVARRVANNPEPCVFCPPIALFNGRKGCQAREQDLLRGLAISVRFAQKADLETKLPSDRDARGPSSPR
jgi:hypothetical protein